MYIASGRPGGQGKRAEFTVVLEPGLGTLHQDAAKRIELADAIPEFLDLFAIPNHLALEGGNLVLPTPQVFDVRRDAVRIWPDPVCVIVHMHLYASSIIRATL